MTPRLPGRFGALALLLGLLLLVLPGTAGAQGRAGATSSGATVDVVEIEGLLDEAVVGYLTDTIAKAERDGAEVVVVQLDTPGGLGVDAMDLIDPVASSDVPVVVWVGPPGARALGAGAVLAGAAHVLAVAPATTVGVAAPVDLRAGGADDDAARQDDELAALLAELAGSRGRDAERAAGWAQGEAMVTTTGVALPDDAVLPEGVDRAAVTDLHPEAVVASGAVDVVAGTLPALLEQLGGRTVRAADGESTLGDYEATANVRFNNPGLLRRVMHTVANPTLAYILLVAGALALLFEVFQPGFGVAGATGVFLVALGVYGVAVLPVSWWAFAGVLLGIMMLAVDLALARLGVLTSAGTAALGAGSLLLFGDGRLGLSPWLVVPVTLFCTAFFVLVMTAVLRAQGNQAMAGAEGLAGQIGVVRSILNPEGHIFVSGALWRARAPEGSGRVKAGAKVRVLGLNDKLTLDVELVDAEQPEESAGVS